MANDRVWIVCTSCEERYLITKYYPSMCVNKDDYYEADLGELYKSDTLEAWVIEHLRHHPCHNKPNPHHLDGNPGLVIVTDSNMGMASGELVEAIVEQINSPKA